MRSKHLPTDVTPLDNVISSSYRSIQYIIGALDVILCARHFIVTVGCCPNTMIVTPHRGQKERIFYKSDPVSKTSGNANICIVVRIVEPLTTSYTGI